MKGTEIRYEIYDANGPVGSVSGEQLREHFGLTKHDSTFNATLVERWNEETAKMGGTDRMRTIVLKNGKKVS